MNATPAFQATPSEPPSDLLKKIRTKIKKHGPLTFRTYMEMALYDPKYGYYATGDQRVGQAGDFITSVSIGRCFGMILARRLISYWRESGKKSPFYIIEPGAHDGSLCADILSTIQSLSPEFYQCVHYHLIEATPALIQTQHDQLNARFAGKWSCHADLSAIHDAHGALLSNELVDAFPVELISFQDKTWKQLWVTLDQDESLTLTASAIESEELKHFCHALGDQFPEGYTTEYNPDIRSFSAAVSQALTSGLFITIDYGHSTEDYYHPDRSSGTLQTYYQHQKSDNPLIAPGEIDITSHVDFSRLAHEAETHGFETASLRTQASYLTDHARNWLLDIENPETENEPDTPKLLRQFQTLIHPAMLGTKFTVIEMTKK